MDIRFNTDDLYTNHNIKGIVAIYDSDDKSLETTFIWRRDDRTILKETKTGQKSGEQSSSILSWSNYTKGDTISLEAYSSDGNRESEHKNIEILVKNSPPSTPLITGPADGITVRPGKVKFMYKSIDNDEDNLSYHLYINGTLNSTTQNEIIFQE
jgi:hypothetical protein